MSDSMQRDNPGNTGGQPNGNENSDTNNGGGNPGSNLPFNPWEPDAPAGGEGNTPNNPAPNNQQTNNGGNGDAMAAFEQFVGSKNFLSADKQQMEAAVEGIRNGDLSPLMDMMHNSMRAVFKQSLIDNAQLLQNRMGEFRKEVQGIATGTFTAGNMFEKLSADLPGISNPMIDPLAKQIFGKAYSKFKDYGKARDAVKSYFSEIGVDLGTGNKPRPGSDNRRQPGPGNSNSAGNDTNWDAVFKQMSPSEE